MPFVICKCIFSWFSVLRLAVRFFIILTNGNVYAILWTWTDALTVSTLNCGAVMMGVSVLFLLIDIGIILLSYKLWYWQHYCFEIFYYRSWPHGAAIMRHGLWATKWVIGFLFLLTLFKICDINIIKRVHHFCSILYCINEHGCILFFYWHSHLNRIK